MSNKVNTNELQKNLKAMAILDMIMVAKEDDWLRLVNYYHADNEYGYILDNGSGDRLTIRFVGKGVIIIGFDHENELNQYAADEWDSDFIEHTYANVPQEFAQLLSDDDKDETTFCMWSTDGITWMQNEVQGNDGGKEFLLGYICPNTESWCEWAEVYYDTTVDSELVEKVYRGEMPKKEDIIKLNPECNVDEVLKEMKEAGIF